MDRTIQIVAAILAVVIVASVVVIISTPPAPEVQGPIYFFYGEECPHCHNVMPFVINMTKKYPDADIQILEIWHNQTNQLVYTKVNADAGINPPGVPEVVSGKTVLVGDAGLSNITAHFEPLIQDYLKKKS